MAYSLNVYRICKTEYANDLKGKGAYIAGGRWNSPGNFVLYTASSISLSILEVLANYSQVTWPEHMSLVTLKVPKDSIKKIELKTLKKEWACLPVNCYSQSIGDNWLNSIESLILSVPSAINHREINYLINPSHPLFSMVKIEEIILWNFDPRLINSTLTR
jgi:RES domain-containing protein